jgi:hypothetical protein
MIFEERIKQSVDWAQIITEDGVSRYTTGSEFESRLAESIIRECAAQADELTGKKILAHFGLGDTGGQ